MTSTSPGAPGWSVDEGRAVPAQPWLPCLALVGSGYEENARHELEAVLAIEPRLLDHDAAFVTQEMKDAPDTARAHLRQALVAWVRSHGHRPEETS